MLIAHAFRSRCIGILTLKSAGDFNSNKVSPSEIKVKSERVYDCRCLTIVVIGSHDFVTLFQVGEYNLRPGATAGNPVACSKTYKIFRKLNDKNLPHNWTDSKKFCICTYMYTFPTGQTLILNHAVVTGFETFEAARDESQVSNLCDSVTGMSTRSISTATYF